MDSSSLGLATSKCCTVLRSRLTRPSPSAAGAAAGLGVLALGVALGFASAGVGAGFGVGSSFSSGSATGSATGSAIGSTAGSAAGSATGSGAGSAIKKDQILIKIKIKIPGLSLESKDLITTYHLLSLDHQEH